VLTGTDHVHHVVFWNGSLQYVCQSLLSRSGVGQYSSRRFNKLTVRVQCVVVSGVLACSQDQAKGPRAGPGDLGG